MPFFIFNSVTIGLNDGCLFESFFINLVHEKLELKGGKYES